jgi:hypothetical protein
MTGFEHGGLYGTAVATMGMLSTAAYILAMDTFGPITDNAGGIVEMSKSSEEVRKRVIAARLIQSERFKEYKKQRKSKNKEFKKDQESI